MWNTLRAIKDEALATAKELRDAHNPEHWTNEEHDDHDAPNAFRGPASVLPPSGYGRTGPVQQPPHIARACAVAPAPVAAQPNPAAAAAPPSGREDDVTARLAALKAKLAAKTAAPRTTSGEPSPATAATAAPAAAPPTSSAPAPAANQVDTAAIINLQHQLENERRHFAAQLDAARNEINHHAAQCQSLETALANAQARAVEAEEVARREAHDGDEEHEKMIVALRAEIEAAQEEVMAERSKASAVSAQVFELQERIDRAEAAEAGAGDHNELENELIAARMESAALREEIDRLKSQALSVGAPSSVSKTETTAHASPEIKGLRSELDTLKQALAASENEKNAARQQLSRLKSQMLSEQDDEEEKIKWRVEAEVKLALEKMGKSGALNKNGGSSEELHAALDRAQRAEEEAARWEQTASARDAELANLQRALGEMSYESDAAERLRADLRALQAEVHTLRNALDAARVSALSAENKVQQAQAEVVAARGDAKIARDAETEAKREVLAARVAAQEALKELQDLRKGGGTIDRSAVVLLIAGLMVQKRPKDALNYAIHAINLSNEEVESIKTAARQNTSGSGGVSLASSWIDFLESAVQEDGSTNASVAPLVPPLQTSKPSAGPFATSIPQPPLAAPRQI